MAIECIEVAKVHITLPCGKTISPLLPVVSETVRTAIAFSVVTTDLLIWTVFGEYLSSGQPAIWKLRHCETTDTFRLAITSSVLFKHGIVLPNSSTEETGANDVCRLLGEVQTEILFLKKQQEVVQKLLS